MSKESLSLVAITGHSESSCGYCHSQISKSFGMWAYLLTPETYQSLIDCGWRRSGKYLYKLSHETCCPAYPKRLSVDSFKISHGQKKVFKHIKSFLRNSKSIIDEESRVCKKMDIVHDGIDEGFLSPNVIPRPIEHCMIIKSPASNHCNTPLLNSNSLPLKNSKSGHNPKGILQWIYETEFLPGANKTLTVNSSMM